MSFTLKPISKSIENKLLEEDTIPIKLLCKLTNVNSLNSESGCLLYEDFSDYLIAKYTIDTYDIYLDAEATTPFDNLKFTIILVFGEDITNWKKTSQNLEALMENQTGFLVHSKIYSFDDGNLTVYDPDLSICTMPFSEMLAEQERILLSKENCVT
ncbi:MAG: hypothetical protein HWE10_13615 [Gammaproteobacteria bacterium]|nr:hypothetical protein [Gammaproteobacteria bacterium]